MFHSPISDGSDKSDGGRVETVQQNNHEAHGKNEPLNPGERVLIDECLNIHSRAAIHFFSRSIFAAAWCNSRRGSLSLRRLE